ncbi:hypothetical protein [Flavobacterium ajazii]|uniref:hypothetical protein n=1 Tax=Flavobacterium ajazii TaxID=2692318 RepID=UPI0013D7DBEE|nr:hypothetical protein [Flavobacterium ajazii]
MKNISLLIFIILLTNSCSFQTKEFTVIGKWKAIESSGLDVSKMFHIDIEDGEEITFEKGNIAIDHLKNKGTYEVFEDNLHIVFPKDEYYYIIHRHETDPEKMYLQPVDEYGQIMCDEGCSTLYKKIQ